MVVRAKLSLVDWSVVGPVMQELVSCRSCDAGADLRQVW